MCCVILSVHQKNRAFTAAIPTHVHDYVHKVVQYTISDYNYTNVFSIVSANKLRGGQPLVAGPSAATSSEGGTCPTPTRVAHAPSPGAQERPRARTLGRSGWNSQARCRSSAPTHGEAGCTHSDARRRVVLDAKGFEVGVADEVEHGDRCAGMRVPTRAIDDAVASAIRVPIRRRAAVTAVISVIAAAFFWIRPRCSRLPPGCARRSPPLPSIVTARRSVLRVPRQIKCGMASAEHRDVARVSAFGAVGPSSLLRQ